MEWLLSNEDFDAACEGKEDWMMNILWENGIISDEHAKMFLIGASTDFDVPDCPFCGANDNRHYPFSDGSGWRCKVCKKKFSLTTGRYIDHTKIPVTHWWRFAWLISKSKVINSCAIARDLEITQKSAWSMINTLKTAMKDSGITMKNASLGFKNDLEVLKLLMGIKTKPHKLCTSHNLTTAY